MNERELLVDCLRRLNRTGVTYYLTGSMASNYWGISVTLFGEPAWIPSRSQSFASRSQS
jgi:hypothetical protein